MTGTLMESPGDGGGGLALVDPDAAAGTEEEQRGQVVARRWSGDDWALVVGTGSDLAELCEEAAKLPAGLQFSEAFGDVDLVLVYRPVDAERARQELLDVLVGRVVENGGMLVGPVGGDGLSECGRFATPAERAAFAAGQADALATMRRALTRMLDLPSNGDAAATT
jgi:uncharacterized repeat protein (TIGR03917 family)